MTVTIPTGDLTGLLGDVIPFASNDDESQLHRVRLEWDGTLLHAMANDGFHLAWSSWHPEDAHDEPRQDSLFAEYGGPEEPWAVEITLSDAKHVRATFKLGKKEWATPVTLALAEDGSLMVARSHETGYSALTATLEPRGDVLAAIPSTLAQHDVTKKSSTLRCSARLLADFAKVRPRGPLHITFTERIAHVSIGDRFMGAIVPTYDDREEPTG